MKFTENQLKTFAQPLSDTENQKCINAIEMVRDALKSLNYTDDNRSIESSYENFGHFLEMRNTNNDRKIKIMLQGSYANNTNIKADSDVDIAVIQEEIFRTVYREGITNRDYGFITIPKPNITFKDEVLQCLKNKFGNDVERKNKSIKINGNSYRKDADAVPCIRRRDYSDDYRNDSENYVGGIIIDADDGTQIINFPEQHIRNGIKKNKNTNRAYKRMVRIIKNMKKIMPDYGYTSAKSVSSFGLESLLWNVPNTVFTKYNIYRFIFDDVVQYLYNNKLLFFKFKEANGIKPLTDVENYKRFVDDLSNFYEYNITE